eukprot:12885937-Ditylum_brightwellii.AAC.1
MERRNQPAFQPSPKTLVAGITCKLKHSLPKCNIQEEKTTAASRVAVRGTAKAVVLKGGPAGFNLIVVSVYDQTPVHFLLSSCEEIKWIIK